MWIAVVWLGAVCVPSIGLADEACGGVFHPGVPAGQSQPGTDDPNASFRHSLWDPRVAVFGAATDITLTVFTDNNPTSVEIDPDDGGPNLPLTEIASNTWEVVLPVADVTNGYLVGDLHNVVGQIVLFDGAVETQRRNLSVNVLDETVPPVPITPLDVDAQASPYVFNLREDTPWEGITLTSHTMRFYDFHEDGIDFIATVGNYEKPRNRTFRVVRNDILGVGLSEFDNSAAYGSAGALHGVMNYPIDSFYDMGETAANHEIGHRWINHLSDFPPLAQGTPHWPKGDIAHGVMGQTLAGGAGGQYPWVVTHEDGEFTCTFVGNPTAYNPMELYLMGLIPPGEVPEYFTFDDQSQPGCGAGGTATFFTIDDVIAAEGARLPDHVGSQKLYRTATIVLSAGRLLNSDEMAYFDHLTARGERGVELRFTSGLNAGITKPFFLATGGRAGLLTRLPCRFGEAGDTDGDGIRDCEDNCPSAANADQTDGDGDGTGDACDNCTLVRNTPQEDADGDNVGEVCDVCPGDFNPTQADADGDGVGNACDACPADFDPSQADADGDGAGDACDCQAFDPNDRRPGDVPSLTIDAPGSGVARLTWAAAPGADGYSVSRGDAADLPSGGYGSCRAQALEGTTFDDPDVPAPGQVFTYLVQGDNFDCGLGPLGYDSQEQERQNGDAGSCTAVIPIDRTAVSESLVYGSQSGSLAATLVSDDIVQQVSEEITTGDPATRTSRLEHRWEFDVAPGARAELHVEGFRTTSIDGETFVFDASTDGGANWTRLALGSLPTSDDGIDLVAPLPAGASGSTWIRVIDTDRTPGRITIDRVSIDWLFVRTVP